MKKQIFPIVITLVLIAVGLSGCTQEEQTNALDALEWSNAEFGMGLNPPADWTIDDNPSSAIANFIGSVEDFANIMLLEPDDSNGESITTYAELSMVFFQGLLNNSNYTLESNGQKTINSMNGYEIIYSYDLVGIRVKAKQVLIEKDNKFYMITYTAYSSAYETYISDVDNCINSIIII